MARSPFVAAMGCAALLLSLPIAALPQAVPTYEVEPEWPSRAQARTADYGEIDVTGVAVGRDGRIYICQGKPSRHRVLVFDGAGNFITSWMTRVLVEPHSCRVDPEGNVWFTDFYTNQVTKFSPDGQLLAAYGERGRGRLDDRHFKGPTDIAFAPNGDCYVSEGDGDTVARLSSDGRIVGRWGRSGRKPGRFRYPHSIAVDAQGRVYVADRMNKRVQVFTAEGEFLAQWPKIGTPFSLFITPEQRVFVADGRRKQISIFTPDGRLLSRWGRYGKRPGRFVEPHSICVDRSGILYVADGHGKRVQRFIPR